MALNLGLSSGVVAFDVRPKSHAMLRDRAPEHPIFQGKRFRDSA